MHELKFEDRVKVWRNLRDELEVHQRPFHRLLQFLGSLHISSKKSNAFDPKTQIQPWHLLDKNSFTEYEIAQICAYTLQLTERFSEAKVEIHISKDIKSNEDMFLVYLDGSIVLGYKKEVITPDELPDTVVSQKIYHLDPLH
tara:strand:+ start:309 stop:734 length:426 start_codon:yes stop_codon:yes gene_type:complete